MKTERLNVVIFTLYSIVFVLQSAGYLSPAWFIREYRVKHGTKGFHLDGKRFVLVGGEPMKDDDVMSAMLPPPPSEDGGISVGKRSILIPSDDGTDTENGNAKPQINGWELHDNNKPTPPISNVPRENNEKHANNDNAGPQTNSEKLHNNNKPMPPRPGDFAKENNGNDGDGTAPTPHLFNNDKPPKQDLLGSTIPQKNTGMTDERSDIAHTNNDHISHTLIPIRPPHKENNVDMMSLGNAHMIQRLIKETRILHVTAGLWYGRACVNSGDLLRSSGEAMGTEWCTMYIRTNTSTLDNQKDVFEFRIEASVALGVCLIGLLAASSACCSQPRQGTKMVITLVCMFVSGAVMLVPVIHMIVQHQNLSGLFHRQRSMSRFMVHNYVHHDLFDHWSVILCACGSIISVLGSILFMAIGCRHQKPDSTKYDLSSSEKGYHGQGELPINWARNNKITVPSSNLTLSEKPDSLAGDDSDYHTETKEDDSPSEGIPSQVQGIDGDDGNEFDDVIDDAIVAAFADADAGSIENGDTTDGEETDLF